MKPAAGYRPLAYSSPEAVQTTGTVAGRSANSPVSHARPLTSPVATTATPDDHHALCSRIPRVDRPSTIPIARAPSRGSVQSGFNGVARCASASAFRVARPHRTLQIIAGSERFHGLHLLSADAGGVALQERRRHQAMSCGPRTGFAEMLNQETGDVRFCQVLVTRKRPGIGDLA